MIKAWSCVCILLLSIAGAQARVSIVEAGPGLTDKYITAISKDGRGLLWIGTKQGLCTYDGNHFEPVAGALQSGNAVNKLVYEGRSGRMWAATDKGLYAIRCDKRRAFQIANQASWSTSPVADMCALPDGRLYVAYKSGMLAFVAGKRLVPVRHFPQQNGSAPFFTGSLLPYGAQALELTPYGNRPAYLLTEATSSFQAMPADTTGGAVYFKSVYGHALFSADFGKGLQIRDIRTREPMFPSFARLLQAFENVIATHHIGHGVFYLLCKPSRLYRVDLRRGSVDTIASDVFMGRLSTCLYMDDGGIVWVGTNKGLIKVTQDRQLFMHELTGSSPISIRSLAEDEQGNLYAGTYSGLFRLGNKEKAWKSWSGMLPYAMLNMPGRYLYFVGEQPALFRIDKQSLKVETGFYNTENLPSDGLRQAYAMACDAQGTVWIGTSYGLATYEPRRNLLSVYRAQGLPPNTEIRYIRIRADGHLLLCTRSGMYDFVPGKGMAWHIGTATKPALSSNNVNYADVDRQGRLWLCTDNGVNIVSAGRKGVKVLRTEEGLSDNTAYQLMWQGDKRVWISTFNGLSSYSLASGTFYNYYVDDGLTSNEFNHNAFLRTSSGKMLFGSINGLNAFDPDSMVQPPRATRLFASTITKWDNRAGRTIDLYPDTNASIRMGPFDHSLTFNLALTDYHSPESQIFLYRIKGLFDEWVPLSRQRSLRLDGLAGGRYVLEIKALDSRGAPAVNTLHYRIGVAQPFYKSWWLYLLLLLFASGLLYAFFYLRLQSIRRVQRLREQIASDLHDEVGSLLTRITMTSDNLRYSSHSEADRSSKLQKIAVLSRTAASSMSDILWAIDARNDYTGNLADRMREHAEEMLAPIGVYPEFDFAVSQKMSIPSQLRQELYLIYKEAINNIVKHSQPRSVRIIYHHNEQGFLLRVVNDGFVMKEKPSAKGQGLKNIRMRAEKLHAQAITAGEGSHFTVSVQSG